MDATGQNKFPVQTVTSVSSFYHIAQPSHVEHLVQLLLKCQEFTNFHTELAQCLFLVYLFIYLHQFIGRNVTMDVTYDVGNTSLPHPAYALWIPRLLLDLYVAAT